MDCYIKVNSSMPSNQQIRLISEVLSDFFPSFKSSVAEVVRMGVNPPIPDEVYQSVMVRVIRLTRASEPSSNRRTLKFFRLKIHEPVKHPSDKYQRLTHYSIPTPVKPIMADRVSGSLLAPIYRI